MRALIDHETTTAVMCLSQIVQAHTTGVVSQMLIYGEEILIVVVYWEIPFLLQWQVEIVELHIRLR